MHRDGKSGTGILIVVSAPSGAGKTSILHRLFERMPACSFSVSVTTREARRGERDGVDYHFVDDKSFDRSVEEGDFLEWAEVHGHRYGTLKSTVVAAVEKGEILILDTDTVGAFNIRQQMPDAVLVFIAPPSPDILRKRLENRDTETEERLQKRLAAAPVEIAKMGDYDYIVINDRLEDAARNFEAIIRAEMQKSPRIIPNLSAWRSQE